ncbi:hypothetical protein [Armatimonas sp.]|uniref:hypothetical protein n=1 Tax=Armatimonas sp. TaxID=1872638 RepID=UPI00374CE6B3
MGTRKKLLLGALGFVATTTTLALWQTAPKIERVARRLPMLDTYDGELHWLSNHEVIAGNTHTAPTYIVPRIVDLTTGTERPLPVAPHPHSVGLVLEGSTYRDTPIPSPDGKWLLYEEGGYYESGYSHRRTGWLLVRSDGSEQRKLTAPTTEKDREDRKTFWLPDSSGWYVFWCNYRGVSGTDASYQKWLDRHDLSGKRVSSRRIRYEPEKILSDGHLAYKGFLDAIVLCRPDSFDACEALPDQYQYPPSASSVTDEALSYDTKSRFMIFTVKNKPIPEQDFWEALFHHSLPRAHREFWLVSRDGKKSRCLATDDVSNIPDGDSNWRILSWSPDGKRVLLSRGSGHSINTEVYSLEL